MLLATLRRASFPECLASWRNATLAVLGFLLCVGEAGATDYYFNGGGVTGCVRSSTTYSCSALPLYDGYDSITIASGYTVNVTSDVGFGSQQGLKMSGSARLTSTGALNIADIDGARLQISGGSLSAGAAFNAGNTTQTLTANISAASIYIGNGSTVTINGSLTSSTTVNLGSNTTINGAINATSIYTIQSVRINGNVTVSNEFNLAASSTMTGNITAKYVRLQNANVSVTGSVTASVALTLDSGSQVHGDISTGTLTLNSSAALVDGKAIVDKAILGPAGRVTDLITCRGGTVAGNCDCVVNNSGYPVNSTYGPHCTGPAPPQPHHIRISHPSTLPRCAPSGAVTLIACNNATCTPPHYSNSYQVTLTPGNQSYSIAGTNSSATIVYAGNDRETLAVTPAGSNATDCVDSVSGAATDCSVTFKKSGLILETAASHFAETLQTLTVTAVKYDQGTDKCVPAFANATRNVTLSCGSTAPMRVPVRAGSTAAIPLNAGQSANAACDATGQALPLTFNASGVATTGFKYADAGPVSLRGTIGALDMTGATTFVAVPASLAFSNVPVRAPAGSATALAALKDKLIVAYPPGTATLTARNSDGATTPGFAPGAGDLALSIMQCTPASAGQPAATADLDAFVNGVAKVNLAWLEVGSVDLAAVLTRYLGITAAANLPPGINTNSSATMCKDGAGAIRFVPAYFDLEQRIARPFYYSGEAIALKLIARNADGAITTNYTPTFALPLAFAANAGSPAPGKLSNQSVTASEFMAGVARATAPAATATAGPIYTFNTQLTGPRAIVVSAANADAGSRLDDVDGAVTIRSGRLRLSNRFGGTSAPVRLPVTAEYWSGNSWLLNTEDNFTVIPADAVATTPSTAVNTAGITLAGGRGTIALSRSTKGSVDVALNLGATANDQSCLAVHPNSTGARLAYLRSVYGCASSADRDPSARASFGAFSAETRRIIYLGERFQ